MTNESGSLTSCENTTASAEIAFTDPWFRDTPLTAGFSLFNTERELDVYNRKDVGGGIRFGRPVSWPDYTRGLISYDLRNVTLYLKDLSRELKTGESIDGPGERNLSWTIEVLDEGVVSPPRRVVRLSPKASQSAIRAALKAVGK